MIQYTSDDIAVDINGSILNFNELESLYTQVLSLPVEK